MKKQLLLILTIFSLQSLQAQKKTYKSLAILNTQSDMPFGKFSGMFNEPVHPGLQVGLGTIHHPKKKHEWFNEWHLDYFFHRFVQHGISFTYNYGYRYKVKQLGVETLLGIGLMQSIPATSKLRLNSNGEYENDKGLGRLQGTLNFDIGLQYSFKKASVIHSFFIRYEQKAQCPFVRTYVPILPYNSVLIGINLNLRRNNKINSK